MINTLTSLFIEHTGLKPVEVMPLEPAGSDRRYFRFIGGPEPVLGVYNPHVKENEAYFAFTQQFIDNAINVPEIYKISTDQQHYLVQDLGDESLYKLAMAEKGNLSPSTIELYKKSLKALVTMQVVAGKNIDYTKCFPISQFNAKAIQWDLNYFKYNFLKLSGVSFDEYLLEKEFDALTEFLLSVPATYFMFRDFSRAIFL
jgi:aminoglycoside/choline kinase family phosphotransferase